MIIGVPKEIKSYESRVSLTPAAVHELSKRHHVVYVQSDAGTGSGFSNEDYASAGAEILEGIEEVYALSEMIVKVKEPLSREYEFIRKRQIVFTFFHFASSQALTQAMIDSGSICIAYETVENAQGILPLLVPMSEVAGRMSIQQGTKLLEKPSGGKGILLGGVPGVGPAKVLILGGGVVGTEAAKMAAGLGAQVTLLDTNLFRLRYLSEIMPANVCLLTSNEYIIRELIPSHHLVIGAVLITGAKAPHLITKDMLKHMQAGSVIVDVAIDQGGCFETSRATTHDQPSYTVEQVLHYCVTNMPGAVPYTSTLALSNATLPYVLAIADKGWKEACVIDEELKKGLNILYGKVVYQAVAEAFGKTHTPVNHML